MSTQFLPLGIYEDIINILGQWKIIDIKGLREMCHYDIQYPNLLKKIRLLESHGFIKSILLGRKNKYIFLTKKGLVFTPYDHTYEIVDENITHDIIASRVLKELLEFDALFDGRMFHQISSDRVIPDAQVNGKKGNIYYKLALEVELTQKSQSRVKEKFRQYGRDKHFDYCLFITNKETLFRAYKRYLQDMGEDAQEKIILSWDKKLSALHFNYQESTYFYMGENPSFGELFDE